MTNKWLGGLVVALLLCACGGGHKMSPEELAHKLDSVKALEIKEKLAVTSRCMPFAQEQIADTCVCCGKPAKHMVYWGKAY